MEKKKDLRDMTLNELDGHLRENGVDDMSTIIINLDSGARVSICLKPQSTMPYIPYTPYPPSNNPYHTMPIPLAVPSQGIEKNAAVGVDKNKV